MTWKTRNQLGLTLLYGRMNQLRALLPFIERDGVKYLEGGIEADVDMTDEELSEDESDDDSDAGGCSVMSSTSTLIFPSHHPLHVSHITAMPEKNVCRYLNKVDSRWRACVTITRYTCILDVTLDPPKRVDFYPNYEIHFY